MRRKKVYNVLMKTSHVGILQAKRVLEAIFQLNSKEFKQPIIQAELFDIRTFVRLG